MFNSNKECTCNWLRSPPPPPHVQVRADYIRLLDHCVAGYKINTHTQKNKIGGGGWSPYLDKWTQQWGGRRGHVNGRQWGNGNGLSHYGRGQDHINGGHSRGDRRQEKKHSGIGGAYVGQGYIPNPTHPQDVQMQKCGHQNHRERGSTG